MGILNITTDVSGQIGVTPRRVKIITTDNLATVTTAGYLNTTSAEGYTVFPTDVIDMWYGATAQPGSITSPGTYEVFTPSFSNGIITLVQWANPGDVLLPVTANHIAVFNGTSGQIKSDATTAINGGNIQAGLSGTAGTLASFPSTASKGSLIIAGVANTGNTNTTISNDAMGQASVVNIPDPANAIGQFMIGATATPFVSGNFPKASGTAGLFVDSGVSSTSVSGAVTQLGQMYQTSVTFNTAQMVTAYDTPLQIVANPSASQMILVHFASVYTASTGNTPYATGTAPIIQYSTGGTNGAHGAGTIATASGLVAGDITAGTSQVRNLFGIATSVLTGLSGKGIYFSNATGDYTGGTGTSVTFTVVYELLTATV